MSTQKGDFTLVNLTCKVKESGETVETTLEKTARDAGLHREGTTYEPMFVIVGEEWVPAGLDEKLIGMEVGQPGTVEIPPEKGYGVRDPSKMRLVPLRRFRAEGVTPLPGMNVQLEGKAATVRSVGAGRVQLDYNHPLSGKTLLYDVTVEKVLESFEEKIKAILHRTITGIEADKFTAKMLEKKLTVDIPEEGFFLEGLQLLKQKVAADVLKFFPEIEEVSFIETVKRREPAAAEKSVEKKPAEEPVKPSETKKSSH